MNTTSGAATQRLSFPVLATLMSLCLYCTCVGIPWCPYVCTVLLQAYRRWVEKHGEETPLPGIELNHDQLFFLNYAQVNCLPWRKQLVCTISSSEARLKINSSAKDADDADDDDGWWMIMMDDFDDFDWWWVMMMMMMPQVYLVRFLVPQIWCGEMRDEEALHGIRTSVHSPGPIRVLGPLSNSEDFSLAYNCPLGSRMNPKHKCSVWWLHFFFLGPADDKGNKQCLGLLTVCDPLWWRGRLWTLGQCGGRKGQR